jgi:hypothetical protein
MLQKKMPTIWACRNALPQASCQGFADGLPDRQAERHVPQGRLRLSREPYKTNTARPRASPQRQAQWCLQMAADLLPTTLPSKQPKLTKALSPWRCGTGVPTCGCDHRPQQTQACKLLTLPALQTALPWRHAWLCPCLKNIHCKKEPAG